jgi:hypothetical protein
MERRESVAGEDGRHWDAYWELDGSVEATSDDGAVVKGWAACPAAVPQLLGPWEISSRHRPVVTLRVAESPDVAPGCIAGPGFTYDDETAAFDGGTRQISEVTAAVGRLRAMWPANEVEDQV